MLQILYKAKFSDKIIVDAKGHCTNKKGMFKKHRPARDKTSTKYVSGQSNNTALPVNYSSLSMPCATSFGSIGMPRRLSCNSFFCYKCMNISAVISILFWRGLLCLITDKEKEVCICVCMCLHAYFTATVYISLRWNC